MTSTELQFSRQKLEKLSKIQDLIQELWLEGLKNEKMYTRLNAVERHLDVITEAYAKEIVLGEHKLLNNE